MTEPVTQSPVQSARQRQIVLAALFDVIAIIAFVVIGRRNHDEGNALRRAVRVAAPFLIGLAVGWVVARAWKAPTSTTTGMIIWPVTVVVGMLLRRFVFDDGTALPFIIVATIFTGLLLVGWRALYDELKRRDLPASELPQVAVGAEFEQRAALDATDDYLAALATEVGEPTDRQQSTTDGIVRRIRNRLLPPAG